MGLADKLRDAGYQPKRPLNEPLWKGPEVDGITFSLLSRFLVCRERFRLLVVEGLQPREGFNHKLWYGDAWHICEEAFAAGVPKVRRWETDLQKFAQDSCRKFPTAQEQVQHWYQVCKLQFPRYITYWAKHQDVTERTPLLQEMAFNVPYQLPSGRTVRLRGKWDSVDLLGKGKDAGVFLKENKTKGQINEPQLKRQLAFDLQTLLYLVALQEGAKNGKIV